MLSLPKLASITGETTNYYSFTQVQALAGGDVELPALTEVSGGPVLAGERRAEQLARHLRLDRLPVGPLRRTTNKFSTLQATNGGRCLDPKLATLNSANLSLDGTGTIATGQIATLTGGTLSSSAGRRP